MSDLRLVIGHYRDKDHFEVLQTLADNLKDAGATVDAFINSFEIQKHRSQLPMELVKIYIAMEATKAHLSIMAGEWNSHVEEEVQRVIKEEVSFDGMEF